MNQASLNCMLFFFQILSVVDPKLFFALQIAWFEKDRCIFCPHFVQLSNSVYYLSPQFLCVKRENLENGLSGFNSKLVGFYKVNGFLFPLVYFMPLHALSNAFESVPGIC